ncbi:YihY/virulence factor BrkB family protein [Arundinibacter roseus]|uniref:YihY/virulence factor BrkB family protein n=1 Tax=Arundinibacter roseus TaxID=2070510 RepID=A0A4R4KJ11_9BACT|nr:YihY/virulence factor BrkB family protein [Arundinibacter roseus]TDB68260.1 YihY/virulence factor BrkB family protein [Arundinibacter roseus]
MLEKILENRYFLKISQWLKSTTLFRGSVSLYDILVNLLDKLMVSDIDQRATAVAFSLTLSAFPALISLFTLIPYIPVENLQAQIMEFLREIMPRGIYTEAQSTILEIISRPRRDILSIGFILTIVTSTNGMVSLMRSFNIVYKDIDDRGFFRTRAIALMLTMLLGVVLFLSVVLLIIGDRVMDLVKNWNIIQDSWIFPVVNITRYLTTFTSLAIGVSLIYRFAPHRQVRLSFFNIGAILASALIVLATYGFSFYLSNFGTYNTLYGSIGTMIALMVWIYLISLLLIFGFELNASIIGAKKGKEE